MSEGKDNVVRLAPAPKLTDAEYAERVKLLFKPEQEPPHDVERVTMRLETCGLAAFGLPEMEMAGIPPLLVEEALHTLNGWATYSLRRKPIYENETVGSRRDFALGKFILSPDPIWQEREKTCLRLVTGEMRSCSCREEPANDLG
jgi:hypothetical protein